MDIIHKAQDQAFMSFRDTRRTESRVRSPLGYPTNMITPINDQAETEPETLFQPPPPANPRSFSDLSDLGMSQQSIKRHEFSDSGYGSRPSLSTTSQHDSSGLLEQGSGPSSGCDHRRMNGSPMHSTSFDAIELPNSDKLGTPGFQNVVDHNHLGLSSGHYTPVLDQNLAMSDNTPPLELWMLDPELMDINFSDWGNDGGK